MSRTRLRESIMRMTLYGPISRLTRRGMSERYRRLIGFLGTSRSMILEGLAELDVR